MKSLHEYHQKRKFELTPEPRGKKSSDKFGAKYLIQKHDASRLHYDFRLELDGVLKSWAVPKGPSTDSNQKRLAVQVEDHPLEYGEFEGIIPKGQYGGGTVMLWDTGTWEPIGDARQSYRKGHLKFRLHGKRLQGIWNLIRIHHSGTTESKTWLLMCDKESDKERTKRARYMGKDVRSVVSGRTMGEIAQAQSVSKKSGKKSTQKSQLPIKLQPMLATLVKNIPQNKSYIYEAKLDGYRILAKCEGKSIQLWTRNGKNWTNKFPELAHHLSIVGIPAGTILDGEVVVNNPTGVSDFAALQQALKNKKTIKSKYFVFDLPYLSGESLENRALVERKKTLNDLKPKLEKSGGYVQVLDYFETDGKLFFDSACKLFLEGIIAKEKNSKYIQDRSRAWLKMKCGAGQEFVIGGYTEPTGKRSHFGSLLLGYYDGGQLVYAGKVGTGFDQETLSKVYKKLKKIVSKNNPFQSVPKSETKNVTWVAPDLIAQIEFTEWTSDKRLRHPSFKGLREDKTAKDVRLEKPMPKVDNRRKPNDQDDTTAVLTHPDKLLFPQSKITKRELAAYYQSVGRLMLPFLCDRPLSVVRCPDGEQKECFFQKHLVGKVPHGVTGINIAKPSSKKKDVYLSVSSVSGLVALVQMGVLEIHPWGSREKTLEKPDIIVFDLDPGEGVTWSKVIKAAKYVRDRLIELGLKSFVKTSGGKGLHVTIPILPDQDWQEVKDFCKAFAVYCETNSPKEFTANMSKAKRKGKIFIDYLRNGRGATSVAPYSTRAKPNAPVAMPLTWDELSNKTKAQSYTITNRKKWLKKIAKRDPWNGFFQVKQSLFGKLNQSSSREQK